jgi:ribosomal protein RSM22 (predicted rRNA methylase)
MRNFYEMDTSFFIDIKKYLDNWCEKLQLKNKLGEYNKPQLQSLASQSQNLWDCFNSDREDFSPVLKDKHYMENFLNAYLASFLLPNIERVFSILVRDENILVLRNYFLVQREEFVIVDFGAGPLSATIGFLCALEYLFKTNSNLFLPKKIKIYAIERSEKIFQAGKTLLNSSIFELNNIQIEKITSTEKILTEIDFALCANVFNEIPLKHRLFNLLNIDKKLNLNGSILILEPGQDLHAKALGKLRNDYIAHVEDIQIVSPCSHKKTCPLSADLDRKDWCWFRHGWNQPEPLKEIEKYSKVDHHFLNFSYVFFCKSKTQMAETFYARVVSDKLNVNLQKRTAFDYFKNNIEQGNIDELTIMGRSQDLSKVLLCSGNGNLQSTIFEEQDSEMFRRGVRFVNKTGLNFIFNER